MKLAQITDLHARMAMPGTSPVPRRHSRRVLDLFRSVLADVRREANLLVITGDLLDVPGWLTDPVRGFEQDEPAFWRQAAKQDYLTLRDLLDDAGLPYMVLPGNHDDADLLREVFGPADRALDVGGFRICAFDDHEYVSHMPRRFTPSRHRWEAELESEDPRPQVHLQHYVVTPTLNEGYPHTYAEGEELRRRIVASGRVRLCLSGHYHAGTDLIRTGDCTFATGPAFGEPPFRWRVYELHPDKAEVTMTEQRADDGSWGRRRGVFLDRDGVINDVAAYSWGPQRMNLLPGSAAAVRKLNDAGMAVVVVSSQSCVGRGYVPPEVLSSVMDRMHRLLMQEAGAHVEAVYASHGTGECAVLPQYVDVTDAKPAPTMLRRAAAERGLEITGSWMVGDRMTDVQTALAGGLTPVLVRTGRGRDEEAASRALAPNLAVYDDLAEAVDALLAR